MVSSCSRDGKACRVRYCLFYISNPESSEPKKRKAETSLAQKGSKPKRKRGEKAKAMLGGPKVKANKQADDVCHHCGQVGHWLRNCKAYLEQKRFVKGMYIMISICRLVLLLGYWILDVAHISVMIYSC